MDGGVNRVSDLPMQLELDVFNGQNNYNVTYWKSFLTTISTGSDLKVNWAISRPNEKEGMGE